MKKIVSFTLDKETLRILELLIEKEKFRNKSHIVELAIKLLKEKEDKNEEEKGEKK